MAPIAWPQFGLIAPVRISVLPDTVIVPASGANPWPAMNCWFEIAMPLPSELVSATRLFDTVSLVPAVDGDAVGQVRLDHGVVAERVVAVGRVQRPHREAVVTGVADEVVGDEVVGGGAIEVDAIGRCVENRGVLDGQVVTAVLLPETDVRVLDPQVVLDRICRPARR